MIAESLVLAALLRQSPQVTVVLQADTTVRQQLWETNRHHMIYMSRVARGIDPPPGGGGVPPLPQGAVPMPALAPVTAVNAASIGAPGSFQACVISRESGGNPQAVNPASGAGGLYQFLPSTWASLGLPGLPENASVAVQNAAFQKEFALAGTQPWAPSDGC